MSIIKMLETLRINLLRRIFLSNNVTSGLEEYESVVIVQVEVL